MRGDPVSGSLREEPDGGDTFITDWEVGGDSKVSSPGPGVSGDRRLTEGSRHSWEVRSPEPSISWWLS